MQGADSERLENESATGAPAKMFDFELPTERIAQQAVEPRDSARLMVVHRGCEGRPPTIQHKFVRDLPEILKPRDLIVVNDARVLPSRLFGRRPSGGRVEFLLLERITTGERGERWLTLIRASRPQRPGFRYFLPGEFSAELVSPADGRGRYVIEISGPGPIAALMTEHGQTPLPPYIRRTHQDCRDAVDRDRYQTIFARHEGAVAAPTAGLHFTNSLCQRLRTAGVGIEPLTLHVGEATFRSSADGDPPPPEQFSLPQATVDAIAQCRRDSGRVIAVGTTVTRTLESRPDDRSGVPRSGAGETDLVIGSGFSFRFVDALLTNFHLPRTSLLQLVCAFAGRSTVEQAYREAIDRGYRFYSYGDAMLLQ